MTTDGDEDVTSDGEATAVETAPEEQAEESKLNLTVEVEDIGPCRKHVAVTVSESDIESLRNDSIDEFSEQAEVPGFRIGRVPRSLLKKRFKSELADQVKQKVLLQSLEQMSDDNDIDPINQPDIDIDTLDIPDSGDFRYEFDVEVRPEFDIPDYKGFEIDRPSGDVSDEEFERSRLSSLSPIRIHPKSNAPQSRVIPFFATCVSRTAKKSFAKTKVCHSESARHFSSRTLS